MIEARISIDRLIEVVRQGGRVRTGVDVYDRYGTLLLAKEVLVDQVKPLEIIRRNGLRFVPMTRSGGVFDSSGNRIEIQSAGMPKPTAGQVGELESTRAKETRNMDQRLKEIKAIKRQAAVLYARAKISLKKAMAQIRQTKGQFDVDEVASRASELVDFSNTSGHPISYIPREWFFYDDYFYTHAANVCAVGTEVLNRFNRSFSKAIENSLWAEPSMAGSISGGRFSYYYPDDLSDMSLGLFIFDLGKAMVPDSMLNKPKALTRKEMGFMRRHSYEFGGIVLEKNRLDTPVLSNMVQYHHGPLYEGEKNCYPKDRAYSDIPPYVRICKLVDSYEAMVARRSYKDAANQVTAATDLFRTYVHKEPMLQYILHAFVKTIGLYPPGSIVYLKNGQLAYVLESEGPVVLPFTDKDRDPLISRPDPFDAGSHEDELGIDNDRSVRTPRAVYDRLPPFLREIVLPERPSSVRLQ